MPTANQVYYSLPYGDLYDSYEGELNPAAKPIYEAYIKKLDELKTQVSDAPEGKASALWDLSVRQFYRLLVTEAIRRIAPDNNPIANMELYFAGSIAKSQGTFYSDVDAFALFPEGTPEEDIASAKTAFRMVNMLCQRIFNDTRQLCPDPLGINPAQLTGTPSDLLEQLKNEDLTLDPGPVVRSIMSSKPILGHYDSGIQLRKLINADDELQTYIKAKSLFDNAINIFNKPKSTATDINIKKHLTRPIDFMLMALRTEFELDKGDGQVLSAPTTLDVLRKERLIPVEQIRLLTHVYEDAMRIRFNHHDAAHRETDNISIETDDVKGLLQEVEQLRLFFTPKLNSLDDTVTGHQTHQHRKRSSKHKKVGLGLTIGFTIVGAIIGLVLMATGILAPIGVIAFGFSIAAAVGAGATGGLAVGALGYGIYKGVTTENNAASPSPDLDDTERFSSSHDKLLVRPDFEAVDDRREEMSVKQTSAIESHKQIPSVSPTTFAGEEDGKLVGTPPGWGPSSI